MSKKIYLKLCATLLAVGVSLVFPSLANADGGQLPPHTKDAVTKQATPKPATATEYNLSLTMLAIQVDSQEPPVPTVTSSPVGMTCQSECNQNFSSGTVVTLTLANGTAEAWTGCDSSTDTQCVVTMNANKSVVVSIDESEEQGASAERHVQEWPLVGLLLLVATGIGMSLYFKLKA